MMRALSVSPESGVSESERDLMETSSRPYYLGVREYLYEREMLVY